MPSIVVAEKLAENQYLTGAVPAIPEGSLLPDSYSFERGETRAAVVARMQAAMTKTLDQLVPKNSGKCPVASRVEIAGADIIVDRETDRGIETIRLPLPVPPAA